MAWFTYTCKEHGSFKASLLKREKTAPCKVCGIPSAIQLKIGTTRTVEILDNGAMARRVERLHNIEEIMDEQAEKHGVQDEETSD